MNLPLDKIITLYGNSIEKLFNFHIIPYFKILNNLSTSTLASSKKLKNHSIDSQIILKS